MKQNPAKRQRIKFFLGSFIAFSLIFLMMGLIISAIFQRSVYRNIDENLNRAKHALTSGPQNLRPIQPLPNDHRVPNMNDQPLRSNVVVFDPEGKIINEETLGQRNFVYFRNLKLDKATLNKKITLNTNSGSFRTLLVKVPTSNPNPKYAGNYLLILQNIDGELQSLSAFIRSITITLVVAWILAVLASLALSTWSMRPILFSWQRQREFTADAAHELRAPLAVIQSQQEYLLTKPNEQIINAAPAISESLSEIKRLQSLTDNLLTLARGDADQLQADKIIVTDQGWLEKLCKNYQEIASSQKKSLTYQIDKQVTLNVDLNQMKQLMTILLNNALQYTQAHDGIWVYGKHDGSNYEITVGDNGISINNTDKLKIFERFYRADAARNKYTGGNGLGLTIAKWIVTQHAGQIKVNDVKPHGVAFTVSLKTVH